MKTNFDYPEGADMLTRLSSRVVQLEIAIKNWSANENSGEAQLRLRRCLQDPAFNPLTGSVEPKKIPYRGPNFVKKSVCGSGPNILSNTGPDENQYDAGCWYCGVPEINSAYDTPEQAVAYFEENIRFK